MTPPAAIAPMLLDELTIKSLGIDGASDDLIVEASDEAGCAIEGDNMTAVEDVTETPTEAVVLDVTIAEDGKTTKKDSETKDVTGETNNIWLDFVVVPVLDVCESDVVENSVVDKQNITS